MFRSNGTHAECAENVAANLHKLGRCKNDDMSRNIYVLRNHYKNDNVVQLFNTLKADLGEENVFMIYNDDKEAWTPEHTEAFGMRKVARLGESAVFSSGPAVMLHTEHECRAVNPCHINCLFSVETALVCLKKLLAFDWDYMWVFENDVHCNGNWRETLAVCQHQRGDILAHIAKQYSHHNAAWQHWNFLRNYFPPLHMRGQAFIPVMRLSRAGVECLEKELGRKGGFVEVYFPTVFIEHGLTLEEMPAEVFGAHYQWDSAKPITYMRNVIHPKYGAHENKLYHPIKLNI